jgi:hypothetical protein
MTVSCGLRKSLAERPVNGALGIFCWPCKEGTRQ